MYTVVVFFNCFLRKRLIENGLCTLEFLENLTMTYLHLYQKKNKRCKIVIGILLIELPKI